MANGFKRLRIYFVSGGEGLAGKKSAKVEVIVVNGKGMVTS